MDTILQQLGLDSSFFAQFVIFAFLYFILSRVYFRPFQDLIEHRLARTVKDQEAAQKLMAEADAKFELYQKKIAEERKQARQLVETALAEAKKEEATVLASARAEAKQILQSSMDSLEKQKQQVSQQLQGEVDQIAGLIAQKLLSRGE